MAGIKKMNLLKCLYIAYRHFFAIMCE